jgi:hypothetical protein
LKQSFSTVVSHQFQELNHIEVRVLLLAVETAAATEAPIPLPN